MKTKRHLLVVIGLALLLVSTTMGCGSTSNSASDDELQIKREQTQELWQLLMDYNFDLATVETIRQESIDQVTNALKDGEISTIKARKRLYQIYLIEANTIKYLDTKPEYTLLHSFLWEDRSPPGLAWSVPELEKDSERREDEFQDYLEAYIVGHYDIVEEFPQFLKERAKELDIELTYTPKF